MKTDLLGVLPQNKNFKLYLKSIIKIQLLTKKKERELTEKYVYHKDLEAAKQLIISNLRFVVYIAKSYLGYGIPLVDLVQEGNVGLMKAVKKFEPTRNVRLISFAVHYIRAEINHYIFNNYRIVKTSSSKDNRKLFFNLKKFKKNIAPLADDEIKEISEALKVKKETVIEMDQFLFSHNLSFENNNGDSEEEDSSLVGYLPDYSYNPEFVYEEETTKKANNKFLTEALEVLDDRSKDIIQSRWLADNKQNLHFLAKKYQISAERVRQIEMQAMKKMKKQLEKKPHLFDFIVNKENSY